MSEGQAPTSLSQPELSLLPRSHVMEYVALTAALHHMRKKPPSKSENIRKPRIMEFSGGVVGDIRKAGYTKPEKSLL